MKQRTMKIIVTMFFSLSLWAQVNSGDSALREIENLYTAGQYLSAELEARRLSEQTDLNDSVKVQIEKWIAFSLIAQGKSLSAKERFVSLLGIDASFVLDPVLTSPKILSVFNDAKAKFNSQKRSAPVDSLRANPQQTVLQKSITFRTVVFPGWEQLHHGRNSSGYFFLTAGAATLTSGIVFEFLRADARTRYLNAVTASEISSTYDTYNTYRKAEAYSFIAFALVYVASEIDVFSNGNIEFQSEQHPNGGSRLRLSVRF